MPRKPRREEAGAVHHVYARGVNRRTIFEDDFDRRVYLDLVGYVVRKFRWQCFAYCLMTNHIHLLVRTLEPNLGRGMHRLHSFYAQGFNERYGQIGHLFQDRYGSSRILSPERLRYVWDYIDQNPVAAQLCSDARAWPWSGCGATAAGDPPRWLTPAAAVQAAFDLAAS